MKKLLLLPLLLLFPGRGHACLNEYTHDSLGQTRLHDDDDLFRYDRNFDAKELQRKMEKLEKKGLATYQDSSDYGVLLVKSGYVYKALSYFRRLGHQHGNDYTVAANLGTTYELSGNNDSALWWIKKGMELNPQSHRGSEWVHVKILEAKLALAKDPGWLNTHTVLGLQGKAPVHKDNSKDNNPEKGGAFFSPVEAQVMYQLHERLPFMTPPDALMASVLRELAAYQEEAEMEIALMHYEYAQEYAGGKDKAIKQAHDALERKFNALMQSKNAGGDWGFNDRSGFTSKAGFSKSKAYQVLDKASDYPLADVLPEKTDTAKTNPVKPFTGGRANEEGSPWWLWVIISLCASTAIAFLVLRKKKKG